MKRYLIVIVVVCAVALLLWSRSRGQTELKLPESTTDAQLGQELRGLTTLKSLYLGGCTNITDAGLVHLKGLTNLEKLDLFYCDKITAAGVQSLQKALPDCRIMKNISIR